MIRVGHKGADALVPGNTVESFAAAVEVGVDMIELDVLPFEGRVVVAHDPDAARTHRPPTLAEVLDAFSKSPLDSVRIDFDVKLPGAEEELVRGLGERDLVRRATFSGTWKRSIRRIRELDPAIERGWTIPRASRDWTRTWWAVPFLPAALARGRRRLPGIAGPVIEELDVSYLWVFHKLVSRGLIAAAHERGAKLIAWTVDDVREMRRLADLGVDGICSNDPRLFAEAGLSP